MTSFSYPPIAVAKADLTTPAERRTIADHLRAGRLQLVAPGVYARPATDLEYAMAGTIDDRFGHAAAAAWVRQHAPGRPLLPSREAGRHILGLGPRAEEPVYLVPDLPAPVNLKGLARIEPSPAWIGRVEVRNEVAGAILVGLSGDLEGRSAEGLAALGRQVADRLTPVREAVEALAAAAEALPEPYKDVAKAAHEVLADRLENGGLILAAREAPDGWTPPAGPGEPWDGPTVELWQVKRLEHGAVLHEVIRAAYVAGHPYISDGDTVRTSALVWIDEGLGWAHTQSRLYRLGLLDTPENREQLRQERIRRTRVMRAAQAAIRAEGAALVPEVDRLVRETGGLVPAREVIGDRADAEHLDLLPEACLYWPADGSLATIPAAFRLEGDALAELLEAMWSWHGYPAHGMRWILSPCEDLDGRVPLDVIREATSREDELLERVDKAVEAARRALWVRWEAEVEAEV